MYLVCFILCLLDGPYLNRYLLEKITNIKQSGIKVLGQIVQKHICVVLTHEPGKKTSDVTKEISVNIS